MKWQWDGKRTGMVRAKPAVVRFRVIFRTGGGRAMLSAIEILPGVSGRIRPVRLVARDVPGR